MFYILFCHNKEPILLSGGSGFKTFLASEIIQAPVLVLNQGTSMATEESTW
jgi:hypothetical protein